MIDLKIKHCIICEESLTEKNCFTDAGWRETQISGFCEFCESCFDGAFNGKRRLKINKKADLLNHLIEKKLGSLKKKEVPDGDKNKNNP